MRFSSPFRPRIGPTIPLSAFDGGADPKLSLAWLKSPTRTWWRCPLGDFDEVFPRIGFGPEQVGCDGR
jgi:hypothetical protein